MLNPIENIWSVVKADVKSNLAEHLQEMLNNKSSGHLSVREFRLPFLERFIRKSLELIVPALCCRTVFPNRGGILQVLFCEGLWCLNCKSRLLAIFFCL